MNNFGKYAKFYDVFYADKNYVDETEVLRSLMIRLDIKKNHDILEIGCGTGKHLGHIVRYYPNALGIEPSEIMISRADPDLFDKIYNVSVETMTLHKKFDFIYSLFHVFSYVDNIDIFFTKVSQHAKTNAIVCMDFWQTSGVFFQKPQVRSKWICSDGTKIQRIATPKISQNGRFIDVNYDIYIHDESGESIEYFQEVHKMHIYNPEEIINIALRHGFRLIEKCHLTKEKPPEFSDWDAGLVFQRYE